MKKVYLLVGLLCTVGLVRAQQAESASAFSSKFVRDYYRLQLQMVKTTPGFTPPVASRAFGYSGLALYEGVVNGIPSMGTLSGSVYEFNLPSELTDATDLHWGTVANNTLATILDSIYSNATQENKDALHALRDLHNTAFSATVPTVQFENSVAHGVAIANAVYDHSRIDGGHSCQFSNFPSSYVPPVGPGLWVPVGNQTCLQPYWGNNRPFVMEDTTLAVMPPAPAAYSTDTESEMYYQAYQVYYTVENATPEQITIAQYWADGGGTYTPPGHSISMLTDILAMEEANLAFAARSYAQLGMALSDAFLTCWRTKYRHNLLRPITYIHDHIDADWNVIVSTPPFPEYVSGHSSQSGAFFGVMTELFGENYMFVDSTHGSNFGGPRQFNSFLEAAQEAAISRLYGGIHYEMGNTEGLNLGARIGNNINELFRSVEVNVSVAEATPAELNIYPNPATDVLRISSAEKLTCELYDLEGRQLLSTTGQTLDLSGLADGMYVLRASADGRTWSSAKVMKN